VSGPLHDRVAVVTGGSRGIGRAIARRLAMAGADCAITYRREEAAAAGVVAAIEAAGRRGLAVPLDLGEPARVGRAMEQVGEALGRVDILVASAAATAFRPLLEQKEHNVRRTLAVSVESFVALVQAVVPLMRGRAGRVVAISGIDSFQAMTGHAVLGAAKAGVESLVRSLALELGPLGITVNGVNPGFVATDSSRLYLERGLGLDYDEAVGRLALETPVGRLGTVEDVAGLVAYLVSDEAGFLTGQTIVIDGGLTIVSPLEALARGRRGGEPS
jgi:enoyl-[acyl-carrier protein] reductase III